MSLNNEIYINRFMKEPAPLLEGLPVSPQVNSISIIFFLEFYL